MFRSAFGGLERAFECSFSFLEKLMFTIRFGISLDSDSKMILPAYDDTENAKEEKRKIKAQIHPPKNMALLKVLSKIKLFFFKLFPISRDLSC